MAFDNLFSPLKIGAITTANRIFMAPMTRARSSEPGDVPTPMMTEYYRQRAGAGLIITEATQISFQAKGWAGAPGNHTEEQNRAWREIVESVHAQNGLIAQQLWHTGRLSHQSLQPGGLAPVAPSTIAAPVTVRLRDANGRDFSEPASLPRMLETDEIAGIVQDFGTAVEHAKRAGFDLVELHGAHGYLIHQFLAPAVNNRVDQYGGSIENRARFALEVVDEAVSRWSADRVGIRLFPIGTYRGVERAADEQAAALYLLGELAKRDIAYVHISEPDWVGAGSIPDEFRTEMRRAFPGVIIGAGSYTPEKASDLIARGLIDAAAFGRSFISNPDYVTRVRQNAPMADVRNETVYTGEAEGYIDYPALDQ